jgi:hypothetical protein
MISDFSRLVVLSRHSRGLRRFGISPARAGSNFAADTCQQSRKKHLQFHQLAVQFFGWQAYHIGI